MTQVDCIFHWKWQRWMNQGIEWKRQEGGRSCLNELWIFGNVVQLLLRGIQSQWNINRSIDRLSMGLVIIMDHNWILFDFIQFSWSKIWWNLLRFFARFWYNFGPIFDKFWSNFGPILTNFQLVLGKISTKFWLILLQFLVNFGKILMKFPPNFD